MLAKRREVTANAALSEGWRREDRAHVGEECGDGGRVLLALSLRCIPGTSTVILREREGREMVLRLDRSSEREGQERGRTVGFAICSTTTGPGQVVNSCSYQAAIKWPRREDSECTRLGGRI